MRDWIRFLTVAGLMAAMGAFADNDPTIAEFRIEPTIIVGRTLDEATATVRLSGDHSGTIHVYLTDTSPQRFLTYEYDILSFPPGETTQNTRLWAGLVTDDTVVTAVANIVPEGDPVTTDVLVKKIYRSFEIRPPVIDSAGIRVAQGLLTLKSPARGNLTIEFTTVPPNSLRMEFPDPYGNVFQPGQSEMHIRLRGFGETEDTLVTVIAQPPGLQRPTIQATVFVTTQPAVLTFTKEIRTKMFIAGIPPDKCDPIGALGLPPPPTPPAPFLIWLAKSAAFMPFCKALSLGEDPSSGAIVSPLDARVLSIVDFRWQCQPGVTMPVNVGMVTSAGVYGGREGPFQGTPNPIAIRNQILQNSTWGFVSSGHPHPFVEPGFQIFGARPRTDIWHRASGDISCDVDTLGNPTTKINNFELTHTRFPSHRSYFYDLPGGVPVFLRSVHYEPQRSFSNLWHLPSVPAP